MKIGQGIGLNIQKKIHLRNMRQPIMEKEIGYRINMVGGTDIKMESIRSAAGKPSIIAGTILTMMDTC